MQLRQVKGNTWVIEDSLLIPLYKTDDRHCILLDTGFYHQREALTSLLESSGLTPVGILGSHAHRDHSANHSCFQERYHIPVAMTLAEAGLSADLLMIQAMYLLPPEYIANTPALNCLVCRPERVILPEERHISFCGVSFDIFPTPGHTPGHICVMTPDRVLYVGDALMAGEDLQRAKLPYYFAVGRALQSMEQLCELPCDCYIAAHKGIGTDLKALVRDNLSAMRGHMERILSVLPPGRQLMLDEIIQLVNEDLKLLSSNTEHALLYRRLLSKYIDYFVDSGTLSMTARRGMALYSLP